MVGDWALRLVAISTRAVTKIVDRKAAGARRTKRKRFMIMSGSGR
jgi:hypothetical protein